MFNNFDLLAKEILKNSGATKTSGYDTQAKVVRIDGDIAYVHIEGGAPETPCIKAIGCKVGDTVRIRVSGGSAWIAGNPTAPPTDDSKAIALTENVIRSIGTDGETVIHGGNILTGTIDADKLNVKDLSALNATIGGWNIQKDMLSSLKENNYDDVVEHISTLLSSDGMNDPFRSEVDRRGDNHRIINTARITNNAEVISVRNETEPDGYHNIDMAFMKNGGLELSAERFNNSEYEQHITRIYGGTVQTEHIEAEDAYIQYIYSDNMQSGKISTTNVSSHTYKDFSVTFKHPFGYVPIVVVGLATTSTGYGTGSVSVSAHSVTKNGFTIRLFNNDTTSRNPDVAWFASDFNGAPSGGGGSSGGGGGGSGSGPNQDTMNIIELFSEVAHISGWIIDERSIRRSDDGENVEMTTRSLDFQNDAKKNYITFGNLGMSIDEENDDGTVQNRIKIDNYGIQFSDGSKMTTATSSITSAWLEEFLN